MQLGTGLFTAQDHPDDARTTTEHYEDIITLTKAIEAAGLDSAWTSEHHFEADGYLSATMPVLGGMAAVTEDIEIGPCIALAPLYHPVRLAEDAATISHMADDRLTLGLAIGSNPREFEAFGISPETRADRLEDLLAFLPSAWSDGSLGYESDFHDVDPDVEINPRPSGEELPIMLGGAARSAVHRAARQADAWCSPSSLSLAGVEKRVEDIRNVREAEGIDGDFGIYVLKHGWVADSREEAWEAMREGYFYLQRRYVEIFGGEPVESLAEEKKAELKEQAVFGPPSAIVDQLEPYREVLGDDIHVILRTYYPGTGTEETIECINRLGDEVAPELR